MKKRLSRLFKAFKSSQLMAQSERDRNIVFHGSTKPVLKIGAHSYINGATVYCWDPLIKLSIGKYCSIADDVLFLTGGEHSIDWVSTYPFIERWKLDDFDVGVRASSKGDIKVGHDVWIGHGATILSGVEVGVGAVIGARAVVTKNVPPYAVVVGNPGKVIKYRFEDEVINCLLASRWWDWDEQIIKRKQSLFLNPIEFCREFKSQSN